MNENRLYVYGETPSEILKEFHNTLKSLGDRFILVYHPLNSDGCKIPGFHTFSEKENLETFLTQEKTENSITLLLNGTDAAITFDQEKINSYKSVRETIVCLPIKKVKDLE